MVKRYKTKAEGLEGLSSSNNASMQQNGPLHMYTSGDRGLGAALIDFSICKATLQPHCFTSASRR